MRTLRPPRPSSGSIDIWRTHDSRPELVAVLSRRSLDDLIDIPVQFSVGAGGDFFQIVDVRPDFRAEGAEVGWVAPVCYDSCAAEVDEKAGG